MRLYVYLARSWAVFPSSGFSSCLPGSVPVCRAVFLSARLCSCLPGSVPICQAVFPVKRLKHPPVSLFLSLCCSGLLRQSVSFAGLSIMRPCCDDGEGNVLLSNVSSQYFCQPVPPTCFSAPPLCQVGAKTEGLVPVRPC